MCLRAKLLIVNLLYEAEISNYSTNSGDQPASYLK